MGVPTAETAITRDNGSGLATQLGAHGVATDSGITLGRSADGTTLAHELVHRAQISRFGFGPGRVSSTSDPAEREAVRLAPQLLSGEGILEVRERPSARYSLQAPTTENPVPANPLMPGPAQPNPDWSFDPYTEDVVGVGNMDLAIRALAVRDWLANHSLVEVDYFAFEILSGRLETEINYRIELGHLWLEDIENGTTVGLIKLVPGMYGAMDIIAVSDMSLINGVAADLQGQPVMTMRQFDAYCAVNGLPRMQLGEYLDQVTALNIGGQIDPNNSSQMLGYGNLYHGDPFGLDQFESQNSAMTLQHGVTTASAFHSRRDLGMANAFANQNASGRQGALSELYFGTSRDALYGLGVIDQNSVVANHPMTDFQSRFGMQNDISLKSRVPDTQISSSRSLTQQFSTYLEGHAKNLDASPGSTSFERFMEVSSRGRTPAQVRERARLMVNADDFDAYRALIGDPFSSTGGASDTANYQRAPIERIYNGVLQDRPIDVGDGGPELRTLADIDAALGNNRIGILEHQMHINDLAARAQGQVMANTDYDADVARNFERGFANLHESLRPEAPAGEPRFTATRNTNSARANSANLLERYASYFENQHAMLNEGASFDLDGRPVTAAANGQLHIDPADVTGFRDALRQPMRREATASGGQSRLHNYQRAAMQRVYDGVLAQAPQTASDGTVYNNVQAIDAALADGRLTTQEHFTIIDRIGRMAANTVVANDPAGRTQARGQYDAQRARANDFIRRYQTQEAMHSMSRGGGVRGDLHAARTYGIHGTGFGAGLGGLQQIYAERNSDWSEWDTYGRIGEATAREGVRGGIGSFAETYTMSRAGRYMMQEGVEAGMLGRFMARGGGRFAGGAGDFIIESGSMLFDGRDNSAGEVGYRLTRATVIGGTSAVLGGMAAGSAWGAAAGSVVPGAGTAIGFVVGAVVGIGLGLLIPTWDSISSGPDYVPPRNGRNAISITRSELRRRQREGTWCQPSHHARVTIIEDEMFNSPLMDFNQNYLLNNRQNEPGYANAHPSPYQMPQMMPMDDADRQALVDWINQVDGDRDR
ncbi:hypothetical protein [Erythrobacter ani]|uniref:DUF4157 domain-containing protein n=1 Tax=Erythrobacter ani TaxID=2827235 RepID=A0ABS6SML2_9SPHN|nr:hypothetical protein [Erythrobacter ani]MBV7266232.1 hypothetical protein [Erythrobacter ani]